MAVRKGNPTKQGLKQIPEGLKYDKNIVRKGNPTKQGLKLVSL